MKNKRNKTKVKDLGPAEFESLIQAKTKKARFILAAKEDSFLAGWVEGSRNVLAAARVEPEMQAELTESYGSVERAVRYITEVIVKPFTAYLEKRSTCQARWDARKLERAMREEPKQPALPAEPNAAARKTFGGPK